MHKILIAVSAFLIVHCGSNKKVGTSGGSISQAGATVQIPKGAVSGDIEVTINVLDKTPTLPTGITAAGKAYSFEATKEVFNTAVTIKLPFDATMIGTGKTIAVLSSSDNGVSWIALPGGTVSGNTVTVMSPGFSIKVPVALTEEHECQASSTGPDTFSGGDGGNTGGDIGSGPDSGGPAREGDGVRYGCVCGGAAITEGNASEPTSTHNDGPARHDASYGCFDGGHDDPTSTTPSTGDGGTPHTEPHTEPGVNTTPACEKGAALSAHECSLTKICGTAGGYAMHCQEGVCTCTHNDATPVEFQDGEACLSEAHMKAKWTSACQFPEF
ncbi:MAG: hypothetical protein IT381_26100 [Deltaproteobacteria bacterium]|nr:hypothetical protein [Deltaproteobacteria bacterium]